MWCSCDKADPECQLHLCANGTEAHLAREPFLKYGDRREDLIKRSGVYLRQGADPSQKSRVQSSHAIHEQNIHKIHAYELKIHRVHKIHAYEQEIHKSHQKSCVRAGDSQKSQIH